MKSIQPARERLGATRPFGAPGCDPGNVDEYDRQATLAKCAQQRDRSLHDVGNGVDERGVDDALLQVDNDEGGARIERG
jgi:hypothetical protein